jgi:opacity protein-like surface antigen
MKKIVLASLLATGLMAAGNENYFGVSAGKLDSNFKVNPNPGFVVLDTDFTDTAYHFTLGHYYGENGRISATYTYVNGEDSDTSDAITLSYDFILPVAKTFSLYAGPSLGYTRLDYSDGTDLSGFHYGAQAGAIARVVDNIEIEAGYRYLMETGDDDVTGGNIELDNVSMWYIGANIRF